MRQKIKQIIAEARGDLSNPEMLEDIPKWKEAIKLEELLRDTPTPL